MTPTDIDLDAVNVTCGQNQMGSMNDFFGGDWDFALNGTFADLKDPTEQQTQTQTLNFSNIGASGLPSTEGVGPKWSAGRGENTVQKELPQMSLKGPTPNKSKQPNLYESLRRAQMMGPPIMMSMSPLAGLADQNYFANGGLDWSPPMMSSENVVPGIYPPSPQLVMDPGMMMMQHANRMKRARVSPYLSPLGLDSGMALMPPGYGMFGFPRRATAKFPLSPINNGNKAEKGAAEAPDAPNSKSMPLVLPFAAANTKTLASSRMNHPSSNPVNIIPASGSLSQDPGLTKQFQTKFAESTVSTTSNTLEENIEKNLRSFLNDTKNLQWDNVTVIELKRILRQYELNATGKKAELMQRIKKIRQQYRHFEEEKVNETTPLKEPVSLPSNTTFLLDDKLGKTASISDSSPDTMGSDTRSLSLGVDPLDSLFSDNINLSSLGGSHQEEALF